MGILNFSVEINADDETLEFLENEYKKDSLYQAAFFFKRFHETTSEYKAGILSVFENFLPVCCIIFGFLSSADAKKILIKTNENVFVFPSNSKSDFINYMYRSWETRIDHAYKNYGTVFIDVQNHMQSRNKLHKRYYKRITNIAKKQSQA